VEGSVAAQSVARGWTQRVEAAAQSRRA
jgi:hypothetical protein